VCNFFFFFFAPAGNATDIENHWLVVFRRFYLNHSLGACCIICLCDCDKKHGRHFARDFLLVTPSLYRIEYLTSTFFLFYVQNGIPVEQKGNNNNDNKVDFLVVAFFLVAMCFADRWRNQKEFKGHPCC
jgi:hypothetical protein